MNGWMARLFRPKAIPYRRRSDYARLIGIRAASALLAAAVAIAATDRPDVRALVVGLAALAFIWEVFRFTREALLSRALEREGKLMPGVIAARQTDLAGQHVTVRYRYGEEQQYEAEQIVDPEWLGGRKAGDWLLVRFLTDRPHVSRLETARDPDAALPDDSPG
jgi:hypothetical protein